MHTSQTDEAAIREQAYLLWEKEGRQDGRETEYWERAKVAMTDKSQLDTLTKPAPKKTAKPKAKAAATPAAKVEPKVKAAASKAKAAPTKSAKPKKK